MFITSYTAYQNLFALQTFSFSNFLPFVDHKKVLITILSISYIACQILLEWMIKNFHLGQNNFQYKHSQEKVSHQKKNSRQEIKSLKKIEKVSQGNKKSHGNIKNLTEEEKVSQGKENSHGKRKCLTEKEEEYVSSQKKMFHAKRKFLTTKQQ